MEDEDRKWQMGKAKAESGNEGRKTRRWELEDGRWQNSEGS
jgi:hypothetical protein